MKRRYNSLYKTFLGMGAALVCSLLLLPVLRIIPADAQPISTDGRDQEIEGRIIAFFDSLQRGNLSTAFDGLLIQSPLNLSESASQLAELKNKTEEARNQFGEILNWERYDSKQIGADVIVIRYILKYDRYPVIWSFAFYRKPSSSPVSVMNPNRSVLVEVQFDPSLL